MVSTASLSMVSTASLLHGQYSQSIAWSVQPVYRMVSTASTVVSTASLCMVSKASHRMVNTASTMVSTAGSVQQVYCMDSTASTVVSTAWSVQPVCFMVSTASEPDFDLRTH